MSKKKRHNHNNKKRDNMQVNNKPQSASDSEIDNDIIEHTDEYSDVDSIEVDNPDEDNNDYLEDEDKVDIGELQNLIDEIEDIKPYEERRARRSNMPEREKKSLNIDKRLVLLVTSIVLAVALFVALIVDVTSSTENKESYVTSAKLKEVTNENVIALMNDYVKAVEACDMDTLDKLVDNIDNISADKLKKESEYIESYENIKLHYVKGINDGDLVVFMSYDNKILNIDTPAPGAMMVYVIKHEDDFRIHTGVHNDEEVLKYLEELAKNENVIEYNEDVNKAFEEACKSDKNLAEFKAAITATEEKSTGEDKSDKEETTEPEEDTTKKKK